jgi:hypothetical protein
MAGTTLQETAVQGRMRRDTPGAPFLIRFANFVAKVASSLMNQKRRFQGSTPWDIDAPLYLLGKNQCKSRRPDCGSCSLAPLYVYSKAN